MFVYKLKLTLTHVNRCHFSKYMAVKSTSMMQNILYDLKVLRSLIMRRDITLVLIVHQIMAKICAIERVKKVWRNVLYGHMSFGMFFLCCHSKNARCMWPFRDDKKTTI